MGRIISIQTPFGRDIAFSELRGFEGLSELFEFTLTLTSKNPNLDANQIIGQTATVVIDTISGVRPLNGLVTDFGYQSEDEDEQDYHLYSCIMRPSMWYLDQRFDSRVFVDKNVIDIANIILGEFGIPYQIQCNVNYRQYGHSSQYQETSFNYLNRLFEQEGIYYYFKHSSGSNTLIIVDDIAAHPPIQGNPSIPYHSRQTAPGTPSQAYIDEWRQSDRLATKTINVNDHNYQTAKTKLSASGPTHNLGGMTTEHYDYYTNFKSKDEASHYQQIRAQAYNALSKRIQAKGNTLTIAPGHTFTLARHPHSAANTEHLILRAEYELKEAGYTSGSELSHYRISFTALPTAYQYRPPRHTPKPQVIGTQGATVTGPAGEEVHTNRFGDIKVQFHWDRYGPMNEKSSDWIRVAQGSAGSSFGSINTPRIGEEVLIDFINGDSDRPIVIGRLYNSANPPPWGYPEAAKQSGIKSKSFNSPLENFNELMFNDDAGFELVNFQAQKDLISLIKNDETRTVNHDRTTTIDNDETVTVHGFRTETVDKDETITIHQNRTETVDQNETITIHKNRKERVDDNESISIGGNRDETVHKSEQIQIKGNRDKTVHGNDSLTVDKNRKETVHKSRSLNVDKHNKEFVKLGKSVTVGLGYVTQVGTIMNTAVGIMQAEEIGMIKKTMVGKSYSISVGDKFEISVGDSKITMTPEGIQITAKSILIGAEKENVIIGKDVLINPPGAVDGGGDKSNKNVPSKEVSHAQLLEAEAALEAGQAVNSIDYPTSVDNNDGNLPVLGSDMSGLESIYPSQHLPPNPNMEWDPEVNDMKPKMRSSLPRKNGQIKDDSKAWHEKDNYFDSMEALGKETIESISDSWDSTTEAFANKADNFGNGLKESAQDTSDQFGNYGEIIEDGLSTLPHDTAASGMTALYWQGKKVGADYSGASVDANLGGFGADTGFVINNHNGNVYVPKTTNATVSTDSRPSVNANLMFGKVLDSDGLDIDEATDALSSGEGYSYNGSVGAWSAGIDSTKDHSITGGHGGVGVGLGGTNKSVSKGFTDMELSENYIVDPKTGRINYNNGNN